MIYFQPDLIVEVTGACNRACPGCYAPNFVTTKKPQEIFDENPDLFLSLLKMNNAFNEMSDYPFLTTVRGGEPSLHPDIAILLLVIQKKSRQVMMETHGRWILPQNISSYAKLIATVKELGIIIKVSFDKMHALKKEELKEITEYLGQNGIGYKVAITEETIEEFMETKRLCPWISDEHLIYQAKVKNVDDLIKPSLGVITVKGEYKENLTSKLPSLSSLIVGLSS